MPGKDTSFSGISLREIVDGTRPIPLAGIEGALGEYGPLAMAASRVEDIRAHGGSWQATDNIPAINAALQSLKDNYGGGEVVLPTHKVYAIRPSDTNRILLPDNCRLNLGDARLRVADDSPAYTYIISGEGGPSSFVANVAVVGGEIDQNPADHVNSDAYAKHQFAALFYNVHGFRFEGVNVITGGRNTVVVNGGNCKNARVNGNTFTFVQSPSSVANYDNSAVYLEAIGIEANYNRFFSEHEEQARACIELHGPLAAAIGNQSWNYWSLANLASSQATIDGLVDSYGVTFADNVGYGLRFGVTIWPIHGTTYRQVGITGNKLYISQKTGDWTNFRGIAFTADAGIDGVCEGLDISHNSIEFEDGDTRSGLGYTTTAAIATGGQSIVRNCQITHNTIVNAPLWGIRLGNTLVAGAEHENVLVESNILVNSGYNRSENRDKRVPFAFAGKFTNTRVRNNPLIVTNAAGDSADQRYMWVISGATSGGGNVFESNPVSVNGGHTLPETVDEAIFPMHRPASATTLGSVVKKQEVFDQYGVSQGFIPIYDAIT